MSNRYGVLIRNIVFKFMIATAFFCPWGAGMQRSLPFGLDVSKLFSIFSAVLIAYWAIFARKRFKCYPDYMNLFIAFTFLHILIYYLLVNPSGVQFSYYNKAPVEGVINLTTRGESTGLAIVRYFLFAFSSYAISTIINSKKEVVQLGLAYGVGFVFSLVLTDNSMSYALISRLAGGYEDPNLLGLAALTAFFFSLAVYYSCSEASSYRGSKGAFLRALSAMLCATAIYAILASGSRGTMTGLLAGLASIVILGTGSRNKRRIIGLISVVVIVAAIFLPEDYWYMLREQTNFQELRATGGSRRTEIWEAYLLEISEYIIIGMGFGNSSLAVGHSGISHDPHNTYLMVLTEYGFLGFIFFVGGIFQLFSSFRAKFYPRLPLSGVAFLSLFFAWLASAFFVDSLSARQPWLILALFAAYSRICDQVDSRAQSKAPHPSYLCLKGIPQ